MCNKCQPLTPSSTFPCKLILFDALLLLLYSTFSSLTEQRTVLKGSTVLPDSTEGSGEVHHIDSD